jgi:ryanodine receptor 2
MNYRPEPMDTSRVVLTPELEALTERLAAHVHEQWAAQRMTDGWVYGPTRDDVARQHPCLVPYDELPETEKEYDRIAVQGTVRAILQLGFRIHSGQSAP